MRSLRVVLFFWVALIPVSVAPAAEVLLGNFSMGDLTGWESRVFNQPTRYRLVSLEGRQVLEAECHRSASALYRRHTINLRETPVLHWSWRIEGAYTGLDETKKTGDDYQARVYVVIDGGLFRWRTRALNYVWASSQPAGSSWPSAYTRQNRMVAVRSGPDRQWHDESRDLRIDFRQWFGIEAKQIDGVALMTDCDDARGQGRAWYGDIWFASQ